MVSYEGVFSPDLDARTMENRDEDYIFAARQTVIDSVLINLIPDLRIHLNLPRMRGQVFINEFDSALDINTRRVTGFVDASLVILGAGVKGAVQSDYRGFVRVIEEVMENIERILPLDMDIDPDEWEEYPDFTAEYYDPMEVPRERQERANTKARIMRRTLEGIRELPPELGREIAGFAAGERTTEQPYYRFSRIPLPLRNEALLVPHEVRAERASRARKNVEVREAEVPEPAAPLRTGRTWKNFVCGLGKTKKNCQKNMNAWLASGQNGSNRSRKMRRTRRAQRRNRR